jgi:hypothetical protein
VAVAIGWRYWPAPASMPVQMLAGAPQIDGAAVGAGARVREGQTLSTDATSRARLAVGDNGEVRIEPGTDLKLLETGRGGHRLAMARGEISAFITAPPRLFFVETPSAIAVDLGCIYTLSIDDAGAGLLQVASGMVALEWQGRSVEVPAGKLCAIRPGVGPGAPWAIDAPTLLVTELGRIETGQADDASIRALLLSARRRDTITLWHLLASGPVDEMARGQIFDALAALAPAPGGVSREAIVGRDLAALEAYRKALAAQW